MFHRRRAPDLVVVESIVDSGDVLHLEFAEYVPRPGDRVTMRNGKREVAVQVARCAGRRAYIDLHAARLPAGRWRVSLGNRVRRRVITADPGLSLDALAAYASQARRTAMWTIRARNGALVVRVRAVRPFAEVTTVTARDGEVEMDGFLAYSGIRGNSAAASLVLVSRVSGCRIAFPAAMHNAHFSATVELERIASERMDDQATWDAWLDIDGTLFRLGSRLDDIVAKKGMVCYPSHILERRGRRLKVQPRYTGKNNLTFVARERAA